MTRRPALALLALIAGGCLGVTPDGDPDAPVDGAPRAAHLVASVTDPTRLPIEGARVGIEALGLAATTDADGTARLDALPPGEFAVGASAPGHAPAVATVRLAPGAEAQLDLVLVPLPVPRARVDLYEFDGFFECTATTVIVTGDCFAAARALPLPDPLPEAFNVTNARFAFAFPVPADWTRIEILQTWDDELPELGAGMRVNLEPADAAAEGHAERYAVASGSSPLGLVIERGATHENATDGATVPLEGGVLRTRTFHNGLGHNGRDPPFLGAGLALQKRFTMQVAVHAGG